VSRPWRYSSTEVRLIFIRCGRMALTALDMPGCANDKHVTALPFSGGGGMPGDGCARAFKRLALYAYFIC
jgi:hypothetical protein